jgi:hypothetical protein
VQIGIPLTPRPLSGRPVTAVDTRSGLMNAGKLIPGQRPIKDLKSVIQNLVRRQTVVNSTARKTWNGEGHSTHAQRSSTARMASMVRSHVNSPAHSLAWMLI